MSSLSSSSSSSSALTTDRIKQESLEETPCKVYFYTRPIVKSDGKGVDFADHWLLYFEWDDYSCTIHANNHDGKLKADFHKGEPEAQEDNAGIKFKKRVVEPHLVVSPQRVMNIAISNKYSDTSYNLWSANCQKWVYEVARILGFEDKLPLDQVQEAGIAGSVGTGAFGSIASYSSA